MTNEQIAEEYWKKLIEFRAGQHKGQASNIVQEIINEATAPLIKEKARLSIELDKGCDLLKRQRDLMSELQTELAEAKERLHVRKETMVAMKDRLSLVETENARLREALGEIGGELEIPDDGRYNGAMLGAFKEIDKIATTALNGEPTNEKEQPK